MPIESVPPDPPNPPDALFGEFLAECGITNTQFVRKLNDRAKREHGVELGVARTTVGHWRHGMRPRAPVVADLAAAELSSLLGYTVTPTDLGWRGTGTAHEDHALAVADTPAGVVRTLAGFSGRDLRHRVPARDRAAYAASAFADPVLAAITGGVPRAAGPDGPTPAAEMARDMAATLRRLDARHGGADLRAQAAGLLHDRARALLPGGRLGRGALGALGELAQLAGWLARDCGDAGAAQRYHIQALALAEHAGDVMLSGRVLAGMAGLACGMGDVRRGVSLARAGLDRVRGDTSPLVSALLHDRLARAYARAGDGAGCAGALTEVDVALARAVPDGEPAWAAHYGEGDEAACRGWCALVLGRYGEAAGHLRRAMGALPPERGRARACARADLAVALLRGGGAGDTEAALEAAREALGARVSSAVFTDRLRILAGVLRQRGGVAAAEWLSRARGRL